MIMMIRRLFGLAKPEVEIPPDFVLRRRAKPRPLPARVDRERRVGRDWGEAAE